MKNAKKILKVTKKVILKIYFHLSLNRYSFCLHKINFLLIIIILTIKIVYSKKQTRKAVTFIRNIRNSMK